MKKYFNIAYLLPFLCLLIFLLGMYGCDKLGKPDIRDEYKSEEGFDYFGWKWRFKW